MKLLNNLFNKLPIWIQVTIDMWWIWLLIILAITIIIGIFVLILYALNDLSNTLSNPEIIGDYFGKLIKGYNEAQQ